MMQRLVSPKWEHFQLLGLVINDLCQRLGFLTFPMSPAFMVGTQWGKQRRSIG